MATDGKIGLAVLAGDGSQTLRWREPDSNHRSRVTRPIFECRLWLVPANRKVGAKENRHTKRRALPPRNRWFESCSLPAASPVQTALHIDGKCFVREARIAAMTKSQR